jgi:uncharacterized protein YjbJ (UPF0337 family)
LLSVVDEELKVDGSEKVFSLQTRREKEGAMKPSTRDQVEGKLHEMKGKLTEAAGKVSNDPGLADKGQAEKIAGKIQTKVGQVEKVFEK